MQNSTKENGFIQIYMERLIMKSIIFSILFIVSLSFSQEDSNPKLDSLAHVASKQIQLNYEAGEGLKQSAIFGLLSIALPTIGGLIIVTNLDKSEEDLKGIGFISGGLGLGFGIVHYLSLYNVGLKLQGKVLEF